MEIRNADAGEADRLAQLWYDGWCDAHLKIVPAELTSVRTPESFRERMRAAIYLLKDDELYQFYVSAGARGTGVAAALIADAEARLAGSGVETAWLGCAIGNDRAARFYEKCGWHRARTFVSDLETTRGTFRLEVWRYEKRVRGRSSL